MLLALLSTKLSNMNFAIEKGKGNEGYDMRFTAPHGVDRHYFFDTVDELLEKVSETLLEDFEDKEVKEF